MNPKLQQYLQLAALAVVVVGCFQILQPFIPALLFSAVACLSSWPLYARLRRRFGGHETAAALLMTSLLVVLVIGPSSLLALSLADDVTHGVEWLRHMLDAGPVQPPAWLRELPLIGQPLDSYWHRIADSRDEFVALLKSLIEPTKTVLLVAGRAVASSLIQMLFAAFVLFFFYRDGERLVGALRAMLRTLAGDHGEEILETVDHTVTGVVHGIFGTALAQAAVALAGFWIAGVPGALALAAATFFFSMVPVGPPLLWGGATIWLFQQGQTGWAVFMLLWGLLAISSIDNVVKPLLISRHSSLPMLLIVLGVFGGIAAFGFIGVFIGPPMLAVGLTLVQMWTARTAANKEKPDQMLL
ncbi:AI-2E family transporter [Paucibacter sp. DJ2R-2]|uniref:AI-2E family transporter n=1 Tax=unclassified Roseateles TaxID=2626991 RepID=UPI0021E4C9DF|nr:AI-2E family transporter [Paucibacter sp. DJ2R-2]MCV2422245.1 AI-2E family transporter [Paucibacter sp. DJ4R-1]MCV2440171.1 AI-2E family transporter [Paucibacter sp. DJ2R-2]